MSHDKVRRLAAKLIGAGFHVFPTLHKKGDPNDKKPAGGVHGFHEATDDIDQFEKLLRAVRIGSGWHLGLGVYPGASGHIVLDPDVKDGGRGLKSLAWLESVYGELPGRRVRTPSGGLHVWMTLPDGYTGEIGNKKAWPDIDTRCHSGYVIAPGVFVPWGEWKPEAGTIGEIPAGVLGEIESAHSEPKKIPTEATPGDRHESLVSLAASYWAKGLNRDAVLHGIRGYNTEQCKPPKPDNELVEIVDWVITKEGGPQPTVTLPATRPEPDRQVAKLDDALAVYRKWLHLPDADYIVCALGAVAANILDGDPLWILFVGPPGSGKTEAVQPLAGLEYVHPAATLTEPALLSGVPKKSTERGATGGLLRQIGDFGIILTKDFSGVLSMHRDQRQMVLSALREVFDGSWSRPVGTGGGKVLDWQGKAGFIGAVTPSIDRHSAVMGALGERFVIYRLSDDDDEKATQALRNFGSGEAMRSELAEAAKIVLADVGRHKPDGLTVEDENRLVGIARFVVKARTAVERDGYRQNVVTLPEYEQATRLALQLAQLRAGVLEVGADDITAWRITTKAGLDSIPRLRWKILTALRDVTTWQTYADLMSATGIPRATLDLHVEDLDLLDLIRREKTDPKRNNSPWVCMLRQEVSEGWPDFVHMKSQGGGEQPTSTRETGPINNPSPVWDDKSCERDDHTYGDALDLADLGAETDRIAGL